MAVSAASPCDGEGGGSSTFCNLYILESEPRAENTICMCMCVYIYIYIYIDRGREREREVEIDIDIYTN